MSIVAERIEDAAILGFDEPVKMPPEIDTAPTVNVQMSPYQMLGIKVIERAILDYLLPPHRNFTGQSATHPTPKDKRFAKEFLFGPELENWCDWFNFDYRAIKRAIKVIVARAKATGSIPANCIKGEKIRVEIW